MKNTPAVINKRKEEMKEKVKRDRRLAVHYALNGGKVTRLPKLEGLLGAETLKIMRQVCTVMYCEYPTPSNRSSDLPVCREIH